MTRVAKFSRQRLLTRGRWVAIVIGCISMVAWGKFTQAQESDPFRTAQSVQESGQSDAGQTEQDGFTKTESIGEALSYSTMGDHKRAMELMAELYGKFPNDQEILGLYFDSVKLRSRQLARSGNREAKFASYKLAGELARRIAETPNFEPTKLAEFKKMNCQVLYNEACAFAADGEQENSIESMRQAREWGFANLNFMLNDPDLASVVETDAFLSMLGDDLQKYKAELKNQALKALEAFQPLDFEVELPDLAGRPVRISDYRGKILFLTFWASGNGASVGNLRALQKLQERLGNPDIEVVSVGCERTRETDEATATLKEFVSENDIPFTCLVASPRLRARLKDSQGFPSTMLIDASGKVRSVFRSPHNYHSLAAFVELLLEDGNQ